MATFTDFNNSFAFLPSTGDLALKKDADAVKQSIKNLVLIVFNLINNEQEQVLDLELDRIR